MDGDPFAKAKDRIRLIGRLFFIFIRHVSGHKIKSAHVYP